MTDMKEIFSEIRDQNLERSLTHAQWLYLLQRILPIVQSGKSVSLHTLLSQIVAPDGDQMIDISFYCFLYTYDLMSIHSPAWFDYGCRFAVRVLAHFLAVKNYTRPELMSERILIEQCDKALQELSNKLTGFQPCEALYTGKGRSSKNSDGEHPVYCYQHKGAHKNGHRTCQSVYGLAPWREFFGWASTDVWPGEFVSSTRNKFQNTVFSKQIVKDMPNMIKDLMNSFRQDQRAVYDMFTGLLSEEFDDRPIEIFRRICFRSHASNSSSATVREGENTLRDLLMRQRRRMMQRFLLNPLTFGVCKECSQEFRASWNRLAACRSSTSVTRKNFQTPAKETSECAICFDGQRDFLLVPCGHRGCCEKCTDEILRDSGHCPFCRAKVSGKQRVHDV